MKNKFNIFITIILLCISCIKNFTEPNPISEDDSSNTKIVFTYDTILSNDEDIWMMDINGRDWKNLTNRPGSYNSKVFSSDGSKIVYTSGSEIFLLDIEEPEEKVLTTDIIGIKNDPNFSAAGDKIVFWSGSDRPIRYDIYILKLFDI